jgi:hypothetical protein
MKIGDLAASDTTPFFMSENLSVITPGISMAPQKDISPSPSRRGGGLAAPFRESEGRMGLTTKMQITNTKLRSRHVNGEIDLAPATQVLDVAIAAMLWPTGDRTCSLLAHLLFDICTAGTDVHALRLGRQSDHTVHMRAVGDELAFAFVPFRKNFRRRSASEDAGMD